MTMILTKPEDIQAYRKLALRAALGLEVKGLKRRGQSAFKTIKNEFKLKGNAKSVYEQYETLLKAQGVLA